MRPLLLRSFRQSVCLGALVMLFSQCRKSTGEDRPNISPLAVAGVDQDLLLPADSTTLDASASRDVDGRIVTVRWQKVSGPAGAILTDPAAPVTKVRNLAEGDHVYGLTVTDNKGATGRDTIVLRVASQPGTGSNRAPVAKAGNDIHVSLPVNSVSLDGSDSFDPDGMIVSYQWTRIAGPTATIVQPASAATFVQDLAAGSYQFQLEVRDGGGRTGRDTVNLEVDPPDPNGALSREITLTLPLDSVYLPDQDLLYPCSYSTQQTYRQVTGPATASLRDSVGVTLARHLVPGTYKFIPVYLCTPVYDTLVIHVRNDPQERNTITYHHLELLDQTPNGYNAFGFRLQMNIERNLRSQSVPQLFLGFSAYTPGALPTAWDLLPATYSGTPFVPLFNRDVGYATPEWMMPARPQVKVRLQ